MMLKGVEFDLTGEIEYFRKRFVGGFNRQDVIDYIAKLAQERNDWCEAKERADRDVQALSNEVATLRLELEKARQEARESREYKAAMLESVAVTVSKLEAAFEHVRLDFDTTVESICTEFDQARKTITSLPGHLARAGEGLKIVHAACDAERKQSVINSHSSNSSNSHIGAPNIDNTLT